VAINHAFSNAIADGTNSSIVRPSDWNSAHNFQQDIAGNTAGVSSVSGTNIVWAGGNNVTLSANGQTISVIAGTAAPSPVNVSAGTTSGDLGTVVFADSNGVSFGLNGSTITATVATNYQSQGAYLTTAALSNHSHGNPTLNLTNLSGTTASNSAGFTLSLSAVAALTTAALSNHSHGNPTLALTNISGTTASNSAGLTLSLSAGDLTPFLTTAALSNHSHGNPTLALTNISGTTASNSAGLTLSLSAAAPGGGAGNTISYFANGAVSSLGARAGIVNSTSYMGPFVVPAAVGFDHLRLAVSMQTNSTSLATSANTSGTFGATTSVNAVIYGQGAGGDSSRLESVGSASASMLFSGSFTANANGSEYTVGFGMVFPSGSNVLTSTYSYAATQTRIDFLTSAYGGDFSGLRHFDVPWATTIAQSNYWLGFGCSTSATGTPSVLANQHMRITSFVMPALGNNISLQNWGASNSSNMALWGNGSYSVAGGGTASVVPFSNISYSTPEPVPFFQLIGQS